MEDLLRLCLREATSQPVWGRKTSRLLLGFGHTYYWDNLSTLDWDALGPLLEELGEMSHVYDQCLVNVYNSGGRIGVHKDSQKDIDTSVPVLSISYGWADDCPVADGTKLGSMTIGSEKQGIIQGKPIFFDAYQKEHTAYTRKSKEFTQRINFTLRRSEFSRS